MIMIILIQQIINDTDSLSKNSMISSNTIKDMDKNEQGDGFNDNDIERMPLNLLNTCYVPSYSQQILNNIQPRNIQKALVSSLSI